MKTAQEAVRVALAEVPVEGPPQGVQDHMNAVAEKYSSTVLEVMRTREVKALVAFMMGMVSTGQLSLQDALLTGLGNGVIIGIEMEKQEWPINS